MEALVCKEFGAPESLTVEKVANLPSPGPKQVKIAVHAAGFNFFLDTLMVAGKYQVKPPLPFSPGMECAGVIAEVGPEVTELKVADRVMSTPGHGGMAEEAIVPAAMTFRIPDSMSYEQARGLSGDLWNRLLRPGRSRAAMAPMKASITPTKASRSASR